MATIYNSTRTEGPITGFYGKQWLLVWTMDANGSIYSMSRPTIVSKNSQGCSGYTYAQLTSYNASWTEVLLTSYMHPEIKWVFQRSANTTNIPLFVQCLLSGGNPATYMAVNTLYPVTLDTSRSSIPNIGSNPYAFEHNNSGAEANDIPTFGMNTLHNWSYGMFWGNIDSYTNYGGIMNTNIANIGAGGGNTGDRLLMYVR